MEVSIKKLQEHIGAKGKYAKYISHYTMDSDEDTDYIAICSCYIICIPKDTITINPDIVTLNLVDTINKMVEGATQELTYHSLIENKWIHPKKQLMFVNEEGEKIYVNKSFFTDFLNGAYSETKGFADGITFTGKSFNTPICMWNGDDLVGAFLPIIHR